MNVRVFDLFLSRDTQADFHCFKNLKQMDFNSNDNLLFFKIYLLVFAVVNFSYLRLWYCLMLARTRG
jgi:hypothetical protein